MVFQICYGDSHARRFREEEATLWGWDPNLVLAHGLLIASNLFGVPGNHTAERFQGMAGGAN